MAATTQNHSKTAKVIAFPRPVRGTAKTATNKQLPNLSCADIETLFDQAALTNRKQAA